MSDGAKTRLCAEEQQASLKCIEKNYQEQEKCQPLFDAYKECKKEETRRRNMANNGGKKAAFFPWG